MANEKVLTVQEQEDAMYAKVMERIEAEQNRKKAMLNLSSFQYGGTVLSCELSQPQQRYDKKTNLPILDGTGQPTFWDAIYFVDVAHLGSSRKFVVPLDLGKDIEKGQDYLFEGDLTDVDNKLKVKLITKI